jgi:hypothetical protein
VYPRLLLSASPFVAARCFRRPLLIRRGPPLLLLLLLLSLLLLCSESARCSREDAGTLTSSPPSRTAGKVVRPERYLEGAGFPVNRPVGGRQLNTLDPFLLLDHFGPITYGPGEAVGAPWHPHRGFQTVSYMLQGELRHQDSLGNKGTPRTVAHGHGLPLRI